MDVFDYVIVGAGSAGSALARRLSDHADLRVLLLESGGNADGFWNMTPAGVARMHRSERYNWNYETEPVPGAHGRSFYWPAGKALGGGSAINGMIYMRGDSRDFDHWASLGNAGWGWDDVLPYFRRSETNQRGASDIHGGAGPLFVSDPSVVHPTVPDFIAAGAKCGLPLRRDFGGGDQDGIGQVQYTIRGGKRLSSYHAYVHPVAADRPNLVVMSNVHARRVLLQGRMATGVEVLHRGAVRTFHARREVILSAGALRSPHLLQLSGIGDGQALAAAGVAPVAHLPGVGQNLQDHYAVRLQAATDGPSSYNMRLRGWRRYVEGMRYLATRSGYLALGTSSAAAFFKSGPDVDYADIEVSFRPMTFSFQPSGAVDVDPYHAISGSIYRVRPASRGTVTLRSPDPDTAPVIQPNYLAAQEDVDATVAGIRTLRRILAADPIARRISHELVPGSERDSDADLAEYVRQEGGSVFHPAGSCKMGIDDQAVVDPKLRVRGVDRLRVIDASIMPVVTSSNTNAPSIMIGEKGAAMVLADMVPARELTT